jgi:hypothetical protein
MARRIVLTMLALIGALLVTIVVPLGLITTGHERSSFREDTMLSARALSGLAEDRLADRPPAGRLALAQALMQARRAGGQVLIYSTGRLLVTGTSADAAIPAATLTSALHGRTVVDTTADDQLRVTVPVLGDNGNTVVGAVVLSRSSAELE